MRCLDATWLTASNLLMYSYRKEMRLNLQRWDPKTMLKPHRKVLYIGASGKGKTVAMRAVLRAMPPIDLAIGFTPTDDTAAELARILPPNCIHDSFDLEIVERSLDLQRQLAHKERSLCLIADDCGFDSAAWRSKTIRSLFMNARHNRVSLQIALQAALSIDPSLRTNVDYVVCTACGNHQEKRKLYQAFFGVFETYRAFDQCFTQATSDWRCIVLDQTQPSPSIENSVFWFKADLEAEKAPFRLCKPIFWRFAAHPPRPHQKADVLVVEDKPVDRRRMVVVS